MTAEFRQKLEAGVRQRLENELAQGRLPLDGCRAAVDIDSAGAGPATDTEER